LAPSYTLPSRETIANSLIPQLYESTVTEIKHKLKNIQAICLTTDAWTSINNQSFIALTVHYIDDNTKSSILLGCHHFLERHTAVEMSSFLKDLVKKWNLDNLVTMVVSDNASNILAAIKLCKWRSLECFAHSINLVVDSGLGYKDVNSIILKVKAIVQYFKQSSQALIRLNDNQIK